MERHSEKPAGERERLYHFISEGESDLIETELFRDEAGRLNLLCRRRAPEGEESVLLTDPGRPEACLAFARAVAESHTHPRAIPELWEENCS